MVSIHIGAYSVSLGLGLVVFGLGLINSFFGLGLGLDLGLVLSDLGLVSLFSGLINKPAFIISIHQTASSGVFHFSVSLGCCHIVLSPTGSGHGHCLYKVHRALRECHTPRDSRDDRTAKSAAFLTSASEETVVGAAADAFTPTPRPQCSHSLCTNLSILRGQRYSYYAIANTMQREWLLSLPRQHYRCLCYGQITTVRRILLSLIAILGRDYCQDAGDLTHAHAETCCPNGCQSNL